MFRDTKYVRTMDSLGRVLIPKGALVALDVYGKNNTYSVFIDKETKEILLKPVKVEEEKE